MGVATQIWAGPELLARYLPKHEELGRATPMHGFVRGALPEGVEWHVQALDE